MKVKKTRYRTCGMMNGININITLNSVQGEPDEQTMIQ